MYMYVYKYNIYNITSINKRTCTASNSFGKRYLKLRSLSSVLYCHIPSRCASGAKIVIVSLAVASCFAGGL